MSYRDTLDPYSDSEAQWRQIHSVNLPSIQTETSYTYVLTDANGYKRHSSGSPIAATIPPRSSVAFPVGTKITIEQAGAGQVTIVAGSGVTVNQPASLTLALKEQWSLVCLTQVGIDEWSATGGLLAAADDGGFLLLEDGGKILLEDGGGLLLE